VIHFIDIDLNSFTPWSALIGGLILGFAALIFILVNGRITGISGILGELLIPIKGDVLWRVAFIAGLIMAPSIYRQFAALPPIQINASYPILIIAGLMVGIGSAASLVCHRALSSRLLHLWRQDLSLYLSFVMSLRIYEAG
jgi:hypothetical protein